MGTKTASLQDISQEMLTSGIVCLTGGHDITNTPLLTFPTSAQPHLEYWSSERLSQLLRHYVQWLSVTSQGRTVACLADLQHSSKDVITIIIEAVEKLEMTTRGTVSALYFMKPLNKTKGRLLKKLLGLKPSKKHPKIPLFKVLLMKTYQEVFSQIDLRQLTSDFGGTLDYDHLAWVKLHESVAPCIGEAGTVQRRLPDLKDRVELLQDYEVQNRSVADIQQLLADLTQSYQLAISEAGFQETLDRCKQTLLVLDSTETNERWLSRVHTRHVQHAAECVRELYKDLACQRTQLEDLWHGIEENVTVHLQIQKHRERALEIERRMMRHYEPLLQEHPSVGITLSQAELYRTHFTTTLYEPAKELLSQATEILEDVQRLRERTTPPCDVTDILQQLTVALQPFTHRLQTLQDIYIAVHIFHLLFQKALTWYRKVLKFLPEGLQGRAQAEKSSSKIVQMPVEWQVAVQSFLSKHPPPREQHLARLDTEIPPQVEKRLRVQARALALRLRLLQRLLYSRRLPVKLLATIFKRRAEIINNMIAAPQSREKTNTKDGVRWDHFPLGLGTQDSNLPPPKPARIFDTFTSVSSFSSSDAGEGDYVNVKFFNQSGLNLTDSFSDRETTYNDKTQSEDTEKKSLEGTGTYQRPPNIDVKVISPSRDSDSNLSDQTESRVSGSVASSEERRWPAQTQEEERFIRLTFSPTVHRAQDTDESVDSEELAFQYPDVLTGSESGIEVAETEDSWDSIVDRIKAVSNSNLPNDVKIQCMSHLLSHSTIPEPSARQRADVSGFRTGLPLSEPEARGGRELSAFDRFQQHITPTQDTDSRRHNSFVIARGDVGRPSHRKRTESMLIPSRDRDLQAAPQGNRARPVMGLKQHRLLLNEHHKPAHSVARLRHRLARSLDDLDEIDQHEDSDDNFAIIRARDSRTDSQRFLPSTADMPKSVHRNFASRPARRQEDLGALYPERFRMISEATTLTKSYAGELDKAHLPKSRQSSSKVVAWRSHEDGLDSVTHRSHQAEIPRLGKACSGSMDSGLDSAHPPVPLQTSVKPQHVAPGKSPSRWRQGILEEYLTSRGRERRQSKEFISPSFLKPFHSMHNLHLESDPPMTPVFYSAHPPRHGNVGFRGHDLEEPDLDLESLSDNSGFSRRRLSIARLSDEVEQEYLSQGEVECSLQRSHRILMEAEEKLKRRMEDMDTVHKQHVAHDTNPRFLATGTHQSDQSKYVLVLRNHPEGHETEMGDCEAGQFIIDDTENCGDEEWEESAFVAEYPHHEVTASRCPMAEADFDADVSNISETYLDHRLET